MTHRKREIIGLRNERDFPHLVELALPLGLFRSVFLEIDAFHRERRMLQASRWRSQSLERRQRYPTLPETHAVWAFRFVRNLLLPQGSCERTLRPDLPP
jgi:hypothetical protein